MAARKQFRSRPKPNAELAELLEATADVEVSEEELEEQRISFAYGNASSDSDSITKDSVRAASKHIRLSA